MALNNYSNLKTAVVEWSKRSDALSLIDDFIDLAESEMYANSVEPLLIREMEARATSSTSTSDRYLALPTGFQSMRRLKLNLSGYDCDIKSVAPDQLRIYGDSGQPRFFAVTSQIEFDRVPDSAYTVDIQYYKSLDGLSSSNTTNDILTNYPQIYLHGCLWALRTWSLEEEKAEYHYGKFIAAIRGANKKSNKGRYGSAPFMRIEGATP